MCYDSFGATCILNAYYINHAFLPFQFSTHLIIYNGTNLQTNKLVWDPPLCNEEGSGNKGCHHSRNPATLLVALVSV